MDEQRGQRLAAGLGGAIRGREPADDVRRRPLIAGRSRTAGTVTRMRPLVLVAALSLALALSACAGTPTSEAAPETEVASRSLVLDRLQDRVAEVAAAQSTADPLLADALAGVREIDAIVARLRDPATVDEAKDRMPRVEAAVGEVRIDEIRPAIRDIAFAVDRARASLATAVEDAPQDEAAYLTAQDEALLAMRAYAEAADTLAQVLETHWPLYLSIRDSTATFVEQRWFYRTSEEAAQAYEVELAGRIGELATAQDEIRTFREVRDDAAEDVNATSREAAQVWRDRRSADATATPTSAG